MYKQVHKYVQNEVSKFECPEVPEYSLQTRTKQQVAETKYFYGSVSLY